MRRRRQLWLVREESHRSTTWIHEGKVFTRVRIAGNLPSDEVIKTWPDVVRDDDESWLDIDFEDFENELRGNRGPTSSSRKGFGDASTQADLRKMVSRFEAFLNDESAGLEGVDMDDMDLGFVAHREERGHSGGLMCFFWGETGKEGYR